MFVVCGLCRFGGVLCYVACVAWFVLVHVKRIAFALAVFGLIAGCGC